LGINSHAHISISTNKLQIKKINKLLVYLSYAQELHNKILAQLILNEKEEFWKKKCPNQIWRCSTKITQILIWLT